MVSLVKECSAYSEKDSASLGGREPTPAAGRATGRAHKGHADSRQGYNSFGSPMQVKVLHEACPSQASAVTQLETTAQARTLPGESSGGA